MDGLGRLNNKFGLPGRVANRDVPGAVPDPASAAKAPPIAVQSSETNGEAVGAAAAADEPDPEKEPAELRLVRPNIVAPDQRLELAAGGSLPWPGMCDTRSARMAQPFSPPQASCRSRNTCTRLTPSTVSSKACRCSWGAVSSTIITATATAAKVGGDERMK